MPPGPCGTLICMTWVLWIVIGLAALAGELLSLGLVFGSFGLAALVTAAVARVPQASDPLVQVAVFCVLSAAFLFLIRPAVLPLLPARSGPEMEPQLGPVGQVGVVSRRVDAIRGQIRVGAGEFWTARLEHDGPAQEVGREVQVVGMSGLSALVVPVHASAPADTPGGADPFGLSPREREVLRLVALGRTDQEIARELVLSPRTVHHHVSHILTKMNVDSRVEATRIALRRGLVPEE